MNPGLTKTFTAGGAISKRRLLKLSADGTVIQATGATDAIIGVSDMSADVANIGDRVDVRLGGIAEIDVGGAITRGALITSDANGKAVAAAPAAGVNNRTAGVGFVTYANGDIGDFQLTIGSLQG
ncbi:MAG TPA: hypothetical protein VG960_12510 [Caulobacteraceae bacterium]|nr:hypothetical protein [Caulobacteraceae bacterium]